MPMNPMQQRQLMQQFFPQQQGGQPPFMPQQGAGGMEGPPGGMDEGGFPAIGPSFEGPDPSMMQGVQPIPNYMGGAQAETLPYMGGGGAVPLTPPPGPQGMPGIQGGAEMAAPEEKKRMLIEAIMRAVQSRRGM